MKQVVRTSLFSFAQKDVCSHKKGKKKCTQKGKCRILLKSRIKNDLPRWRLSKTPKFRRKCQILFKSYLERRCFQCIFLQSVFWFNIKYSKIGNWLYCFRLGFWEGEKRNWRELSDGKRLLSYKEGKEGNFVNWPSMTN